MAASTTENLAVGRYERLDRDAQLRVLAAWLLEFTIYARGTYEFGTARVLDPERLREFNEIQHFIAGHLSASLDDSPRYPDSLVATAVVEEADRLGCHERILHLLQCAVAGE